MKHTLTKPQPHVAVLLGPVKALTYVFTHGIMAATLGFTWARRMGWVAGITLGATVSPLAELL